LERIVVPPVAFIKTGATYDTITRILNVSITAEFQQCISGNYKVACAIIEDSVTGTTSDYNQSNYYSYQSQNVALVSPNGFDWQAATNPVPASLMQYDHVARAISPSFDGLDNAYPDSTAVGYSHTHTFSFSLDADWDDNQIHIVGMLIDPAGRIDNAGSATINEAESTGLTNDGIVFITGGNTLSLAMTSTNQTDPINCDGSASVTANGGSPPYNYLWNDGSAQTTAMATNLCAGTYTVEITDCVGETESMTVTLTLQTPTSTQKLEGPDFVKLYPNPATKTAYIKIHLKQETSVLLNVFNSSGQLVINRNYGNLNGAYTLPLITSRLSPGIYALNLQYGNRFETKKLIIDN
jgi:hypothetical protein